MRQVKTKVFLKKHKISERTVENLMVYKTNGRHELERYVNTEDK